MSAPRVATCVALVLAAVGDAGPEILASGSVVAGYDGPGPLIYLAVAAAVAWLRWRYAPLLAVAVSGVFVVGGLADAEFTSRLVGSADTVDVVAAWLQMLSFAAAIVCGLLAVRRRVSRTGPGRCARPRPRAAGRRTSRRRGSRSARR